MDLTITCPKCGTDIEVNEALTSQLEEKISSQIQIEMEIIRVREWPEKSKS